MSPNFLINYENYRFSVYETSYIPKIHNKIVIYVYRAFISG